MGSVEVKEGSAECIRISEVVAALKKMKRHKAPGLSGLTAEMIQATEVIGTQWLLDLCSGIVKGCIPEDWKSSMILPFTKGNVIQWSVDLTGGATLLKHAMKVVERIF